MCNIYELIDHNNEVLAAISKHLYPKQVQHKSICGSP